MIGKKYWVDISRCIVVEVGKHGLAFRISKSVNDVGQMQLCIFVTEIFVATHANGFFPLEFVYMETEPATVYKFLNDRIFIGGQYSFSRSKNI